MARFPVFVVLVVLLASSSALARQKARPLPGFPDGPGKETLLAKCFQCHGPNMWMMQRQDRKAWEGTLYRMVGRGALWTEEEIKAMADYLGSAYGKKAS
jgi:mono/diheme cytochrome c family protein